LKITLQKLIKAQRRKEVSAECCSECFQLIKELCDRGDLKKEAFVFVGQMILTAWEEVSGQDDERLNLYKREFRDVS
jgi:hypothetical protein